MIFSGSVFTDKHEQCMIRELWHRTLCMCHIRQEEIVILTLAINNRGWGRWNICVTSIEFPVLGLSFTKHSHCGDTRRPKKYLILPFATLTSSFYSFKLKSPHPSVDRKAAQRVELSPHTAHTTISGVPNRKTCLNATFSLMLSRRFSPWWSKWGMSEWWLNIFSWSPVCSFCVLYQNLLY